jgi:AraC-like DNA-binding protein
MSDFDRNGPNQGQKFVFSSKHLPPRLDERARFNLWRDLFIAYAGACEMRHSGDRPFSSTLELTQFGAIGVTRYETTLKQWLRSARQASADPRDEFAIGCNRGQGRQMLVQRGREFVLQPRQWSLYMNTEELSADVEDMRLVGLRVPRAMLRERVRDIEDKVLTRLDETTPAAWHLSRFLEFLLEPGDFRGDAALIAHIEATLLDLLTLALGATGEAADIARMRGLRAARLREVIATIEADFANPGLTAGEVATRLGLSGRYVQNLLSETGLNFTDRVLELRLQRARAMLADLRHDRMKISEIALACGFNEVSYFNRCFRRRFGCAPTQYRGGNDQDVGA